MNYQDENQELEIDLIEFMWQMCIQWKPVLAAALVFGMLICGISYCRMSARAREDTKAGSEMSSEEWEEKRISLEEGLSESEIGDVSRAADRAEKVKKRLEKYEEYVKGSYIPDLNPYEVSKATVFFYLANPTTSKSDLTIINAIYQNKAGSVDFAQKLADKLGMDTRPCYIKELFSVYTTSGQQNLIADDNQEDASLLVTTMILPEGVDGQKFIDAVTDLVMGIDIDNKEYKGKYSISPFYSTQETVVDRSIETSQVTIEQTLDSYRSTYKALDDAFNEKQLALYNFITGQEEEAQEEKAAQPAAIKSLAKYFVIGAFAGAFLYALGMLALAIMRPKTGRLMGTSAAMSIRSFGQIEVKERSTVKGDFIYSPFVKNLRKKLGGGDNDKTGEIAAEMAFLLHNRNEKKDELTLFVMGPMGTERKEAVDELARRLKECNITCECVSIEPKDTKSSLDTISDIRSRGAVVVIAVEPEKTLFKDYGKCICSLKESHVEILGSLMV